MSIEIQKSTQFRINELVIVSKGGPIDISNIYEEINIFDSLFSPVISGSVLMDLNLYLLILQKMKIVILLRIRDHFVFTNRRIVPMKV
jgi:hypothetical protein